MSEMQKELDQKVTQLTDEEMGAVNGGDGLLSINEDFGERTCAALFMGGFSEEPLD